MALVGRQHADSLGQSGRRPAVQCSPWRSACARFSDRRILPARSRDLQAGCHRTAIRLERLRGWPPRYACTCGCTGGCRGAQHLIMTRKRPAARCRWSSDCSTGQGHRCADRGAHHDSYSSAPVTLRNRCSALQSRGVGLADVQRGPKQRLRRDARRHRPPDPATRRDRRRCRPCCADRTRRDAGRTHQAYRTGIGGSRCSRTCASANRIRGGSAAPQRRATSDVRRSTRGV